MKNTLAVRTHLTYLYQILDLFGDVYPGFHLQIWHNILKTKNLRFVFCFRSSLILMRTPPLGASGVETGAGPRGCSSSNPLLLSVNLSQTPPTTCDVGISTPASSRLEWPYIQRRTQGKKKTINIQYAHHIQTSHQTYTSYTTTMHAE